MILSWELLRTHFLRLMLREGFGGLNISVLDHCSSYAFYHDHGVFTYCRHMQFYFFPSLMCVRVRV